MQDDAELATAALRRLPPAALAGIREAFAAEMAERLPRLQDAVESGDPALRADAVRDAHALGSSAAVVGEPAASQAARSAEALLLAEDVPAGGEAVRACVADLRRHLHGWAP